MKIITWNVNGMRSIINKGFFEFIKVKKPDVLCLQEIKMNSEIDFLELDYYRYYNFSIRKGYSGVCIFSKIEPVFIEKKIGLSRFDNEGRFLRLDFNDFILINVYMPHGNRDKRDLKYKLDCYKKLIDYLGNLKDKNIILVGDFNIAHDELDLANPMQNKNNIMFTSSERDVFDLLMREFIDCYRSLNPNTKTFSWWPYYNNLRERNIGWRLDYVFLSKNYSESLLNSQIMTNMKGSDHCPVEVELK